ncbi:hypothetical protein Tco_0065873 [Tanacetum coccineum]
MTDAVQTPRNGATCPATDEQILPRIRWSNWENNCYLNEEKKSQPNPLFQAGSYKCQLDEQWFDLTQDTLRDALQITPVDKNRAFSPPPTPDTLIKFVNELGYPKRVINLSNVTTNDILPTMERALVTIINLCLTGKDLCRFERHKSPSANRSSRVWLIELNYKHDYAGKEWEELLSLSTLSQKTRNLAQQAQGKKKATIILIPSIQFTKLIIFHLQRLHNFHPRPESPLHLPTEEPVLAASKKPKPAPAKPQEKKRKPVSESSDAPPLAKRAKAGKVVKKRTAKRNPETGNFNHFTQRVPGKWKEKVGEEQAAQRHTIVPSEPAGHEESSSLYADWTIWCDTESDEEKAITEHTLMYRRSELTFDETAENEKTTADTEAESMVSVTVQQDTSVIPPMTSPVIGPMPRPDSPNVHWPLPTTTTTTAATTTPNSSTLPPQPLQVRQIQSSSSRMGRLRRFIANTSMIENQAWNHHLDSRGAGSISWKLWTKPKMIREPTFLLNTPPGLHLHHQPPPPPTVRLIRGFWHNRASDSAKALPPQVLHPHATSSRRSVSTSTEASSKFLKTKAASAEYSA